METEGHEDRENRVDAASEEAISFGAPSPIDANEEENGTDQQPAADDGKGLEDIESDEDVAEMLNTGGDTTAGDCSPAADKTCYSCSLIFADEESFEVHRRTEYHEMAASGFKPSTGKMYCFLCWMGFKDSKILLEHYGSKEHDDSVRAAKVKAICPVQRSVSGEPEPSLLEDTPGPAKRLRTLCGSEMPEVLPSPLGTVKKHSRNQWVCEDCNVVFSKYFKARDHARSPNHLLVAEGRCPDTAKRTTARRQVHCCFVCWFGFGALEELENHYSSVRHKDLMTRSGVVAICRHDRGHPRKRKEAVLGPGASADPGLVGDFIVVDEVKGSDDDDDDDEENEAVSATEADVLDEVSSDEDVILKMAVQPSGPALDDLEDVDSEEDDKMVQPPQAGDRIVFEDVDSSEDDMDDVVRDCRPPPIPPPPKISLVDEPVKEYGSIRPAGCEPKQHSDRHRHSLRGSFNHYPGV